MERTDILEIYVVRSGDTLYNIARRYSVSTDELTYANQLQNPAVLSVGQALIIPTNRRVYTVRRGDTLYAIARSYGVSLASLIAANPAISDPNRIYVGQQINIPSQGEYLGEMSSTAMSPTPPTPP